MRITVRGLFERHGKRLAASILIIALYLAARTPVVGDAERGRIASRFRFTHSLLPSPPGPEARHVRPVHPSLDHISAWISSVGASIALCDLDGDHRPNDICYVDTSTDQVIITPAPISSESESAARYAPFALQIDPALYDRRTMAPTGCLPGDLNEDGLCDVLVYFWGRTPVAFLRRRADESRQSSSVAPTVAADDFVACEIGPPDERWFTNAATRADVDGDGHVDLIIGNYFQDEARILDAQATGSEEMQDSMSRAFNGGTNRLLLWEGAATGGNPSVRYRDVSDVLRVAGEPVATGWTLAIAAADLDGDLRPEIYFGNDFGPDRLLHNRSLPGEPHFALLSGRRQLTTPRSKVVGHDSFKGMGVDFGDLNGDGRLDIYVSNIAAEYALEESHFVFLSSGPATLMQEGRAPYVDRGESLGLARSGWGWDTRLADFDNDGVLEALQATGFVKGEHNRWPELHEIAMGNDGLLRKPFMWHRFQPGDDLSGHDHNPFFVRAESGRFVDIAAELGVDQPQVSRGIATADVDGDGDLDFAIGNQWEPSRFYENDAEPAAFLGLRLLLAVGNTPGSDWDFAGPVETLVQGGRCDAGAAACPAIGATARATLPDGRILVAQVDGGNGHSGSRSPEIHFGLGEATAEDAIFVEVRWRDRRGKVREESLEFTPGWHTVLLGESISTARR